MPEKMKSRKLWVLIINAMVLMLKASGVEIDPQSLLAFQGLSGTYMVGQGIADIRAKDDRRP